MFYVFVFNFPILPLPGAGGFTISRGPAHRLLHGMEISSPTWPAAVPVLEVPGLAEKRLHPCRVCREQLGGRAEEAEAEE